MPALDLTPFSDALNDIRRSPAEHGTVQMIVRRLAEGTREILEEAYLDTAAGLVGDNWQTRGTPLVKQVTVMNARVATMIAKSRDRWPLFGDQFYVDLDLSQDNLAPGTRLSIGSAIIEVTAEPHRGCAKFIARFGSDALRLVHSPLGKQMRLRGLNARVLRAGLVRTGDAIRRSSTQHCKDISLA